ncbi:MAG: uroporphyrinogen-III C-methyltransferase [Spirochaetia bacterium]|nr:uroporphyrinogen-III C-methyltransferase [Spirochaetia bacterium]
MVSKSKVYLIGAGPGDPDLLTLKAVKAIEKSEVVMYDQLVSKEILKLCKKNTRLIFAGKYKNNHVLSQDRINKMLVRLAKQYKTVGRLKGGDPMLFGRGGEEMEYLRQHNIDCEIIPGITAAVGAAASLGIPLTHRDFSSEAVFLTGHKQKNKTYYDFSSLNLKGKTHVIYMGITRISDIIKEIQNSSKSNRDIPIAIIENATKDNQRVFEGKIENILEVIEKEEIKSPALIIIGETITLLKYKNKISDVFKQSTIA